MAFIDFFRFIRCQVANEIVKHPRDCNLTRSSKFFYANRSGCYWVTEQRKLHCDVVCEVCHVSAFISKCDTMNKGQSHFGWNEEKSLSSITHLLWPFIWVSQVKAICLLICVLGPLFSKAKEHYLHFFILGAIEWACSYLQVGLDECSPILIYPLLPPVAVLPHRLSQHRYQCLYRDDHCHSLSPLHDL